MKILSIVVTFNRKMLLKRCLDRLFAQSNINHDILVVDNGSTDGTKEYIDQYFLGRLKYLSLTKNLGGAGGFAEGIKYSLNNDYDLIWLMDDDGFPKKDCLETLFNFMTLNTLDAISPVQINIDNYDELAFPITYEGRKVSGKFSQISNIEYIDKEANLFNGLLIKAEQLKKVGLPRSELFIRGDEVEYTKRLLKNNIRFGTCVGATFYHPSDKNERVPVLCGLWNMRDAHSDFKNYYMYRNRAVAFIEDGNSWLLPLDFIRYSYYFLIFRKCDWMGLKLWCSATYDGIRRRLGRHPRY
ncbi:glycosyltransferase [Acinetobacter sp. YIM 103518]|uniref:Glycosyltransferase n=1 Tax=Acinetobacter faecalis TaxID=2665161 RepID=A0A6L6GDB6_9GAMM|nr:glycosyltransferase [Acinetobacter faecalis]MTD10591.1 glycosyltransferase [Acinetobacter faecalis]